MRIILASKSPSRKKLLASLQLPFEVIVSEVKEEPYHQSISDPYKLCTTLARLKVEASGKKDAWVIGADQMVYCDGEIFGKPKTHSNSIKTLSRLQNRTHELISGLCIQKPDGSFFEKSIISKLTMKPLTEEQINRYLEIDKPYECAGSYKLESVGVSLFEKIETTDFTAIIGLPMLTVGNQLFKEILAKK